MSRPSKTYPSVSGVAHIPTARRWPGIVPVDEGFYPPAVTDRVVGRDVTVTDHLGRFDWLASPSVVWQPQIGRGVVQFAYPARDVDEQLVAPDPRRHRI